MNEPTPLTPYQQLGGENAVRELVDRFYDYMDQLPEATTIRALHAKSLSASREKLFLFLSGWLGGPSLYVEKYGHPRLRARHLPFPISTAERDQWLLCMKRALADMPIDATLAGQLIEAFARTADHMRNKLDSAAGSVSLPIVPNDR
jgi:hemoglobin